jgi:phosphoribosylglycinamide formyltransferase-1
MAKSFVSEPIVPLEASFDTSGMARGEPGLPHKFRWRGKEFEVAEVLAQGRDHGDCRNGSGERYVRKHNYRARTTDGTIMNLYFQRSVGRGRLPAARWWIQSLEEIKGRTEA